MFVDFYYQDYYIYADVFGHIVENVRIYDAVTGDVVKKVTMSEWYGIKDMALLTAE